MAAVPAEFWLFTAPIPGGGDGGGVLLPGGTTLMPFSISRSPCNGTPVTSRNFSDRWSLTWFSPIDEFEEFNFTAADEKTRWGLSWFLEDAVLI